MESFRQHRDTEVAKIIPFAYERLPCTKQLSLNSSNIIIFQTIHPLEQKLDGRQQAERLHRKAEIIPLRCQRGSSIEQPSWNSSNIIFQTMSSWAETWWETLGKINSEWLEQFFIDIKEGHALVIHLKILQTTYLWLYIPYSAMGCLRLWQCLVLPTFFAEAHLVNEKVGCNAPAARLQTMSSWAETLWETLGKINSEWLEQFFKISK